MTTVIDQSRSDARFLLKQTLLSRRWSYVDLSKATGLALGTIRNVASGNFVSQGSRDKIETVLGVVIWPHGPQTPASAAQPKQTAQRPKHRQRADAVSDHE